MLRVPLSGSNPSFDDTENISFLAWLTSGKARRAEWARRRNVAARAAQAGQGRRVDAWADEQRERRR